MKSFKLNQTKIFTILILLLAGCTKPAPEDGYLTLTGSTMGTTYMVKLVKDSSEKIQYDNLQTRIDTILNEVNRQMSTFWEESEISRFNRYRNGDWFTISKDFASVLNKAVFISKESNGAFDITVGPLVNLWGFGSDERERKVPGDDQIREEMKKIGVEGLMVQLSPPAVKKINPDTYCDLSAIAKGFGVDKVFNFLDSLGIDRLLVEIGGEVRAKGFNLEQKPWKIGISTPDYEFNIQKVVPLVNTAVATSGDYRNYFEKNGVRYSHTIDPRLGNPITHTLASVTVIHDSCIIADALATAINVLGPEEGYQFALERKLPVFMIVKGDSGFIEVMTPEFEEILKLN